MPYWLAIEWNDEELRAVAAVRRRDRLVIEHAFAVTLAEALSPSDTGSGESRQRTAEDIGKQLAAALAARGIRRPTTFVAISRSLVELRQMSVPPVSDEELPDLVRFQALREFTNVNEEWIIDYVLLDNDPSQPRNALVAALAPQLLGDIKQTCQIAQIRPERILLRPCAAATLAHRCLPPEPDEIRLLVDLLGDEVDLSVVVGEKLVFMRTARVTGDPLSDADAAVVLMGEIRRTMMAAQNQLGGGRANHLVLCGCTPAHHPLVRPCKSGWISEQLVLILFPTLTWERNWPGVCQITRDALPHYLGFSQTNWKRSPQRSISSIPIVGRSRPRSAIATFFLGPVSA